MATSTFSNTTGITIPDVSTVTQALSVTGLYGTISGITITLDGLSHTFPPDLDFMLVAPDGTGFVFMSDAGPYGDVNSVTLTFSDDGTGLLLYNAQIVLSTYLPTDYNTGESFPGYAGTPIFPHSGATFASTFGGRNPNGDWVLYAGDDFPSYLGSLGGWSLTITDTGPLRVGDLDTGVTFAENTVNATPQLIDTDVTLAGGLNAFDDGTLVVSGLLAEDVVSIRNEGAGAGQIGFDEATGEVRAVSG